MGLTVQVSTFHTVNQSLAAGLGRVASSRPIERVNRKVADATSPQELAGSVLVRGDALVDTFELSLAAQARLSELETGDARPAESETRPKNDESTIRAAVAGGAADQLAEADTNETQDHANEAQSDSELSKEEQEVVNKLKERDREVRAHEAAHLAAAGRYARGGPTFTTQRGPDGRAYAVGGEVSIDTSPVPGDPEATIRKAQVVRAAAHAPSAPSSQDRAVASAATQSESQARQELREQQNAAAAEHAEFSTNETSRTPGEDGESSDQSATAVEEPVSTGLNIKAQTELAPNSQDTQPVNNRAAEPAIAPRHGAPGRSAQPNALGIRLDIRA